MLLRNCRLFFSRNLTVVLQCKYKNSTGAAFQYCLQSVRKSDYDNFLATLLLPQKSRDAVFALRAFNVELARVPDSTSNAMVARIKFQFWTDTLEKIYSGQPLPEQPVALALGEAVRRHKLTRKWLAGLIDQRSSLLGTRGFRSLAELEAYANATAGHLLFSTLECLGVREVQADHVASHIGKAVGLVSHIRSIPFHAARQRVLLPADLLRLHKVAEEEILRGARLTTEPSKGMKDLIFDLAAQAHVHLAHARKGSQSVRREAKVAFLGTAAVDQFLRRLQVADFNCFDPRLSARDPLLPVRMWWLRATKKY